MKFLKQLLSKQINEAKPISISIPNEEILKMSQLSQGSLLPFYFANPFNSTEEYKRIGNQFYGLKLAPAVHGVKLADTKNINYIEEATSFHHPVYLHCLNQDGFRVEDLKALSSSYPNTRFVLGHAGIGQCDFSAVDTIVDNKNIYFETSGIEYAVKKLGQERIIFGSEYPLQNPKIEILKIKLLNISLEKLNQNAKNLLGSRGLNA
jgi:predicted TIM-barrel fold metal-dependent hydrolase